MDMPIKIIVKEPPDEKKDEEKEKKEKDELKHKQKIFELIGPCG